jgi:hypothetical protein
MDKIQWQFSQRQKNTSNLIRHRKSNAISHRIQLREAAIDKRTAAPLSQKERQNQFSHRQQLNHRQKDNGSSITDGKTNTCLCGDSNKVHGREAVKTMTIATSGTVGV